MEVSEIQNTSVQPSAELLHEAVTHLKTETYSDVEIKNDNQTVDSALNSSHFDSGSKPNVDNKNTKKKNRAKTVGLDKDVEGVSQRKRGRKMKPTKRVLKKKNFTEGTEKCNKKHTIRKQTISKLDRLLNVKNVVQCQLCDFKTTAEQYLGRHMRSKHLDSKLDLPNNEFVNAEPTPCRFCKKTLLHVYSLYRHVKQHHKNEDNYESELEKLEQLRRCKCPYCPTTVTRPSHLKRHINDVHLCDKSTGIKCEQCGIVLKNANCYNNHIRYTHKTEKKCLCTICGNMYKTVGHLNEHLKNVHCLDKFPCDIEGCDFVGNSEKYLKKHKKYKHGAATYMCDFCARKFKCMQRLTLHHQVCDFLNCPIFYL